MTRSKVEQADLAAARSAAAWRDHPLVTALGTMSELADQPQLYTLCWATLATGLLRRDRRLARAGARMLAAEWLATRAKSAIKARVDRTRPAHALDGGEYRMQPGDADEKPLTSFPSGHTAGAVAVAVAFASEYPRHRAAALAVAGTVAAVQVPRCAHYLSDIGVGALIGWAAGGLVRRRQA